MYAIKRVIDWVEVSKKAKIRNRYNQIPHLTQDTIWESDKNTRKHHLQKNQEGQPFPSSQQGCKEQTRQHDRHETQITKSILKRRTALEKSKNQFLFEGLNIFDGANLTIISDADQDK